MNTMRDDELQQFGDDVMQIPAISEISYELLEECVKEQILNSFFSSINYLEEFRTTYEEELEDSGNDDDAVMEVKNQAHNFYIEVLNLIDKKFGLELDSVNVYESMSGDTLRTFTEGLYEFFITNYEDNIITYITEVILDYRAAIVDEISAEKTGDDVTSISYRSKVSNSVFSVILANISTAIKYVRNIEIEPEDFINYFNNDCFSVAVVKYGIDSNLINGDFVKKFTDPMFGSTQDDTYDEISLQVQQNVYDCYKSKKEVSSDVD